MNWWEGKDSHPVDDEVTRFLAQKRREKALQVEQNSLDSILDWFKPWRAAQKRVKATKEEIAMDTINDPQILKLRAKLARDPKNEYIKTMLRDLGEIID